ncbi:KpsF/GutQ family sugar-phosphate isomerase [Sulfurimonas sp. CVO]|jgi:arabinose-5-phosphate isomerase|uniref:KpsF/GutQ family sugar-phosphate isomerase n=1 Tax=Sulfurimonas xiamenensis TaxID=2590021 RepID=A0AAJ4DM10_9BACT|nr:MULTISPECIES: KpsF/GutQ family sugar-phosphate isomerase [Sulfurimonas]QFR42531.1 KpsF/GutQ family sugar-phosphate isomerase [Sulfurimonas xiamenensis]QHG91892.1 KpsF/GutQ family sugar-phosphate isomerase [Sulfurimonas sp. CVO]
MNYKQIAQETLQIEAQTLLNSAQNIDDVFDKAVEVILACKGKLIVTGVGKSGLIGAKMAATFASTGTPSFFLHPTEALHGDLGMISQNDVVIAISYSGESEELSSILPHIKRFDTPLIGMTRDRNSTLGKYSDLVIDVVVEKEACPLNIAPTSSTTLTLALGDALAVCLMKARDFKKSDFASFHPGGALGKQLFVKVKDLMRTKDLPIISADTKVKDAIVKISEGRIGTVLITDELGRLLALVSDGDIRRALMSNNFSLEDNVLKYATLNPKAIDNENMLASEALVIIEEMKIQLLVVTDKEKKVTGVLHIHTLIEKGIS